MNSKALPLALLLGLTLLLAAPTEAAPPPSLTIYFYRDGQAVPVARTGVLTGSSQEDTATLLAELLAGPTRDERSSGLTSPLPPGTELIDVAVSGDQVTVDLRIPLDFLRSELDPYRSDAIVDQIVKTVHLLGLHHIRVRAEDENGNLLPVSDFLPRPSVPIPSIPANDDPMPDRLGPLPEPVGPEPEHVGQPPAFGQGQPLGALTGTTAWLSAGHGWYWDGERWVTQRFNYNDSGIVEDLSNAEAVNYYLARYLWNAGADVWLVRERAMTSHEIIVDNDDGSPAYAETGSWETSSSPGYNGGTYRWSSTFETLTATATWTPNLPEAGWYAVWAWYLQGPNRPTDARYEIHHAGGVTTVSISQEIHGQTWRYLGEYYFEAGATGHVTLLDESNDPGQAVIADAIRFGGGLGSIEEGDPGSTSGRPRWEEAAKYWARYQGAPPEAYASDVTSRPLYAEWEAAKGYPGEAENAVYVSWHTNGGGGTGTDSFIHSTEPTTGSVELQDRIHAELISDLRAAWDPGWVNRGQKSANFGELRELSIIPGVLLEIAFHDSQDVDDLREPVFRQIAARAVYQGVVEYHADRLSTPVHLLPEPPERLVAQSIAPGEVMLTWAPPPCCDGIVGGAATEYKVYHSANGRGFDDGIPTTAPSLTLTGLSPGSLHFFRVTALNEGGESFPTPVVAVRTPADSRPADILIVDGFDRLDQTAMIPQWEAPFLGIAKRMFLERMNRYDYAVEHGQALSACGLAFDGAVNEAIEAGDVALGNYQALDWFVGEDSTADAALSNTERALLAAYLDGGGRLLISGAEIGWDLVERGRDPAFYRDYLRAAYQGDDADTYHFVGVPSGIFAGLAGSFDDSTGGTYDVGYPDRLGGDLGSYVVMNYVDGTADGAAVAYEGDFRLVHFGFPLETVTNPATRAALFCAAADHLLPSQGPDLALFPDREGTAYPGESTVYTHTLTNLGNQPDVFDITHASSQEWPVTYSSPIALQSGQSTSLEISIAVPLDALSGTVDITVVTATSQVDPAVYGAVTDTTTAIQEPYVPLTGIPRLINPGFEHGSGQSAWQTDASDGNPIFYHRSSLPAYVQPHGGDWLAWLGGSTPGTSVTTTLTQVVALPPGDPAAGLSLAWFVHTGGAAPPNGDSLSVSIYDLSGTHQLDLLTLTNQSPTGTWNIAEFDLSAFAGEIVQLAFRTVSGDTAFFVDDVNLVTAGPPGPDEFRSLWVDAYHDGIKSQQQIDELIETAQAGNFNALVVQVRRRGDTYYPSALDPWAPDATPDFDALAYLIEHAHAAGIEVHAWATTLAIWGGSTRPDNPDHTFNVHGPGTTGRDYWLMPSYTGEITTSDGICYLDPGHPDVVDYTVAIYAELATNYELDGLHLDRVRYGWREWGYNPTSLARFQAQTGRSDLPEPADGQWLQWRRDQVTALVRKIYLTITAINPRLRLSAALSAAGWPPNDSYPWETRTPYTHQLQDWRSWLEEGILDLGLTMTYKDQSKYPGQFNGWIAWEKDHQYERAIVVGSGLYLNPIPDSMAQWTRVRLPSPSGNHAWGLSGYSYATPSDDGSPRRIFVNAAASEVLTQTASPPAIPWKDTPTLGHLAGRLTQPTTCRDLDGYPVSLTGPSSRSLLTDGTGWFGTVDLPPGEYLLSVDVTAPDDTIQVPVTVTAGAVTQQEIALPACLHRVYLPLILK